MSIFKRGRTYWFHFWFDGRHVQRSTKQGNPRVARQIEAAYRTQLAKGEAGIRERKRVPLLVEFAPRFLAAMQDQCGAKPATVDFYTQKMNGILKFEAMAKARLDAIDEAAIASFIGWRKQQVGIVAVNRALATLRRALRLAQEWRLIDRVPRIRLLPGERVRDFVLGPQVEATYLAACPEPLSSVARLLLQTGLRLGEVFDLGWEDVHLDPLGDAGRGYIHVRNGKSKHAKRNISLTDQARALLIGKGETRRNGLVFAACDGNSRLSRSTLDHQHQRVRQSLGLPTDFVLHSLRHTMLTRLGAAGADAFTIMKVAGHSTVIVSQRYVHPTPETLEHAFDRLEAANREASRPAKKQQVATLSATVLNAVAPVVQ